MQMVLRRENLVKYRNHAMSTKEPKLTEDYFVISGEIEWASKLWMTLFLIFLG